MKKETKTKLRISKAELIEKLGLKGVVTFIQYDWKNQELIIEGNVENAEDEDKEGGWLSFGK